MTLTEIEIDFNNQLKNSEIIIFQLQQKLQEEKQRYWKLQGALDALQVVKNNNTDGCK